jgi:L-serine dehydratase
MAPAAGAGVYTSASVMFTIGIGPSSSHTVGPMRAAGAFRQALDARGLTARVDKVTCQLKRSLAATGRGHGTLGAVAAGLMGWQPEQVDPGLVRQANDSLGAGRPVAVPPWTLRPQDITFTPHDPTASHPNELTLRAWSGDHVVESATFQSVGGGFIRPGGGRTEQRLGAPVSTYQTMAELLDQLGPATIADLAWRDEVAWLGPRPAQERLERIWAAMRGCVEAGLGAEGVLPGRLGVPRRAGRAWRELIERGDARHSPEAVTVYAMAVSEENAGGGRVVTATTNGAAGILPAVLYAACPDDTTVTPPVRTFLLTATAIGSLIRANASILGAEAGCQAEVGSACAMAAAGLTALRGGTPSQVENAAEIAIEHHLGLTCDPVAGLVQVPCIERNGIAAGTALTASRLALLGTGHHLVSLDTVIETMRQTGRDMSSRYKETSEAGLAVNVVEC